MILTLKNTTTREIANTLVAARENYSLATGRVLTLLVAVRAIDDVDAILSTLRTATREHPARVLVLIIGDPAEPTSLDAEVLVAADAGASEVVVMRLRGELTNHLDAVVTPLLLPDTPIVAWWPTTAPACPAQAPLGNIAQRRITNTHHNVTGNSLLRVTTGYTPGDSDMMWSRITPWRGVVASALDRCPDAQIRAVRITGCAQDPSVDVAAGWLASALNVTVTRASSERPAEDAAQIDQVTFIADIGEITVEVVDAHTVKVSVPGNADAFVALSARTDAESLAEELRHLDSDATYGRALAGLAQVQEA
ncbi:glucose-6-phosphate dehydrogenase assembly protein OpcA [Corynebacterium sp. Q4381]|uniref:glucose-6-phosphate dehydrogenase assembly protein OpcA n=1 Tax=Corynebacterium sp. Marseille-Q4381 TaxID=3121597 RepID=UPI002FE5C6DA